VELTYLTPGPALDASGELTVAAPLFDVPLCHMLVAVGVPQGYVSCVPIWCPLSPFFLVIVR
jgi:hypothetical protein